MPTQQEVNTNLQGQIDDLTRKVESLVNKKPIENNFKDFTPLDFYNIIRVKNLIIRYADTTAANEPSILTNEIILWKDTTNNKFYIKANFNGTAKKVELV